MLNEQSGKNPLIPKHDPGTCPALNSIAIGITIMVGWLFLTLARTCHPADRDRSDMAAEFLLWRQAATVAPYSRDWAQTPLWLPRRLP